MLRQKCFYRNDIETRWKPESKEKIELKFAISSKSYVTCRKYLYVMTSIKNLMSYSNSIVFIAFLKIFKLLSKCTKFHVNR